MQTCKLRIVKLHCINYANTSHLDEREGSSATDFEPSNDHLG